LDIINIAKEFLNFYMTDEQINFRENNKVNFIMYSSSSKTIYYNKNEQRTNSILSLYSVLFQTGNAIVDLKMGKFNLIRQVWLKAIRFFSYLGIAMLLLSLFIKLLLIPTFAMYDLLMIFGLLFSYYDYKANGIIKNYCLSNNIINNEEYKYLIKYLRINSLPSSFISFRPFFVICYFVFGIIMERINGKKN